MSGIWMDLHGPIVADSVRKDGVLVARDVSISLPGVTPQTHDLKAMGSMTIPIPGLLDNMEWSVTKVGMDLGFLSMLELRSGSYECRWIHTITDAEGNTREEGCKAFMRAIPTTVFPGGTIDPGNAYEGQIPFSVSRYQLFVGPTEYLLADRLAGKLRINGKEYINYESLL